MTFCDMFFFKVGKKARRGRGGGCQREELEKEQAPRGRGTGPGGQRTQLSLRARGWMQVSSQQARRRFEEFLSRGSCLLCKVQAKSFSENRERGKHLKSGEGGGTERFAGQ